MMRAFAVATCLVLGAWLPVPSGEESAVDPSSGERMGDEAAAPRPAAMGLSGSPGGADVRRDPGPTRFPVISDPRVAGMSVLMTPAGATSLKEVRQVEIQAQFQGGKGSWSADVELRTPAGLPFLRLSREFVATPAGSTTVSWRAPVAGTLIQQAGLAGRWNATVILAGVEAASVDFELAP